MKLVIYGDIGGSGGYVRYCKGLLSSNSIPNNIKVWFVCSTSFYEKLAPLDSNIKVIIHSWIDNKSRIKRYLWHLFIYPNLIRKIKPDIEFYPSGQLRLFLRKALTVATCHNLLLFDEKELNRFENKTERKYFLNYRKRQINSFVKTDALIFLSKHSQEIVCKVLPEIKEHNVISHGLDTMFFQPHERDYNFKDEIKVLYVSPIFYYKHQKEVVEAIKSIRSTTNLNIILQLVGGGNTIAANELKELIYNENLQNFIKLTDFVNSNDLLKEYISSNNYT
jgi:glycosyltransferase involved in cell wall biosynthesis